MSMFKSTAFALLLAGGLAQASTPYPEPAPSPLSGLDYSVSWFKQADHDPQLPTPEELLGFEVGDRAALSEQIAEAVLRWAELSDRAEIVEYARSYEGRPLHYLVISSPENLARSESIKQGMARLADPRQTSASQRRELISSLPGVAWMAYSIHGNESSGSDAALAVVHHLLADRSEQTQALLDDLVIIVDPDMNPDGRQRFTQAIAQTRGEQPNVDDQSLVHSGYWPYGRGNHYLFDLNRDWIYAIHPETRGRIGPILDWRPLLFVDAHEMGAQTSYLFSPAREPHNPHFPPYRYPLGAELADDMAEAFDQYGYPYYSGEWHEDWYPGYTDAWASLRGSQGILYEQARFAEDGVQQEAKLISYKQGVHQQVLATMANLNSLRERREDMLAAYAEDRAMVTGPDSPYAGRNYVILPGNPARMALLRDLLEIQRFDAYVLDGSQRVRNALDQLGVQQRDLELPAGTVFLPGAQPDGRLLAAMFDFDPQLSDKALQNERERLLREGASTLYDTTAWNITMMYGLEAYRISSDLPSRGLTPLSEANQPEPAIDMHERAVAYAVSGADDRATAFAARLLERSVAVRASDRDSSFDGQALPRGSVVVTLDDNREHDGWRDQVRQVATDLGVAVRSIRTGRADTADAPDLGGSHFHYLHQPKVALIGQGSVNMLDFGSMWFTLDHRLGIRHSHLDENRLGRMDLRRYNVLVLPERWGGGMPDGMGERLQAWVEAGGTLIASGASAGALTSQDWIHTTQIEQALEDIADYQTGVQREWRAGNDAVPSADAIWGRSAGQSGDYFPWQGLEGLPSADELKRRNDWQRTFMPSGAMVAGRVDTDHWLTAGANERLPVLFGRSPVFMSKLPVQAPIRIGVYQQADTEAHLAGWAPVPAGQRLDVRMSGLLWPEARDRIASAAWMTRQSVGNGQVILFSYPPTFRAAAIGSMRLFENAVVYGPGMGTRQPIPLP